LCSRCFEEALPLVARSSSSIDHREVHGDDMRDEPPAGRQSWRLVAAFALLMLAPAAEAVPERLRGRRSRGFGLGPEVQLLQGGLAIRALWEFGVRNNLEGFILTATLAIPF
jgi:hypothetical protein